MRLLALCSFVLFLNLFAQAQSKHIVSLTETQFPFDSLGFRIDSVIDYRSFQASIGTVQKGMMNKRVPADFPKSFATYLTQYFRGIPQSIIQEELTAQLGSGHKEVASQQTTQTVRPIVLIVDEFAIGEETNMMSERGHVEATLRFCQADSTGQLSLLYRITKRIVSGGIEVTASHPRRIQQLFSESLTEFSQSGWQMKTPESLIAKTGFDSFVAGDQLVEREFFPVGFYKSIAQLLVAQPGDTAVSQYGLRERQGHVMVGSAEGRKNLRTYFAYSNGKQLFINSRVYIPNQINTYFSQVLEWGRFLLIRDSFSDPTASATFGLVGALASMKDGAFIDTQNGQSYPLTEKNFRQIVLIHVPDLVRQYQQLQSHTFAIQRSYIKSVNQSFTEKK